MFLVSFFALNQVIDNFTVGTSENIIGRLKLKNL